MNGTDRDAGGRGDLAHGHSLEAVGDQNVEYGIGHPLMGLRHPLSIRCQYERMVPSEGMGTSRYLSLDVLRGIAILGTLGTNVWIFTHPEGLVGYLSGTPDSDWRGVEVVLQLLTQGKFLGLLTVMFGIGLALQRASAMRRGLRWPGSYPWRAALLFLDGVVHFVLMTEFDVLMGYAITGWIVAYLLVTTPRTQRRIVCAAAAVHVGVLIAITVALATASRT